MLLRKLNHTPTVPHGGHDRCIGRLFAVSGGVLLLASTVINRPSDGGGVQIRRVRVKDKEFLAKRHEAGTFQIRDSVKEANHLKTTTGQRYLHLPVWTSIIAGVSLVPMINIDFTIARIDAFHIAFTDEPSYWEDYKGKGGDDAGARFEFRDGWRTVYPLTVEGYLLRVELADGSIGWGEGNCPIGPEVACLVAESLQQPMVRGREFGSPLQLWDFLYDAQRGRGYASGYWLDAMAAIDIALYDAIGRREDVPVSAMLCDRPRTELPVYLSGLRRRTPEDRLENLKDWLGTGLTGVKLFVDGDLDAGTAEVEFLQAGAGDATDRWMVDTLWMVSTENGPEARRRYGELNCTWLECPLEPEDLQGHRELLTHPGAPIALGEHFRTHFQTEAWFESPRSLDIFQPDIGRTGFSDGLRQLQQANAAGVPTTPHMGNGLGPFQAATLHFSTACGHEHLQEYQAGLADRATLVGSTAWTYADGKFVVPNTPGLGVEVDEQALGRYVVNKP